MTLPTHYHTIKKRFEEKYVDKEGCQAGHPTDPNCPYCKRWGGAEGEPKLNKRPTASAGDILSFLHSALINQLEEVERVVERMTTPVQKTTEEKFGLIDYGFQMARNHILFTLRREKEVATAYKNPTISTEIG